MFYDTSLATTKMILSVTSIRNNWTFQFIDTSHWSHSLFATFSPLSHFDDTSLISKEISMPKRKRKEEKIAKELKKTSKPKRSYRRRLENPSISVLPDSKNEGNCAWNQGKDSSVERKRSRQTCAIDGRLDTWLDEFSDEFFRIWWQELGWECEVRMYEIDELFSINVIRR